jgi:hypothetical protein
MIRNINECLGFISRRVLVILKEANREERNVVFILNQLYF